MGEIDNFIDGDFRQPQGGTYLDVYEPATGRAYARVAQSNEHDVESAVSAAARAHPGWKATSIAERSALLHDLARAIEARLEDFASCESRDSGKPVAVARQVDIPRAVSNFDFFAAACRQFASECHHAGEAGFHYTRRDPIGVVGCISPWNLPLYLLTWKIAPALAAGNCVVAKPSEVTPATAHLLAEVVQSIGMPAGVLNLVHGEGPSCGRALVVHPQVKAISFTGGTATGASIAQAVAPLFKKLSLELGGKNPTIVFADCRFDEAVSTSVRAAFANQGQICLCGSRLFVHESLYERFSQAFVEAVRELTVGDPLHESTQQGALSSKEHYEKVLAAIERGKQAGGRLLCGGQAVHLEGRCAEGWFVEPTVFAGLDAQAVLNQEEIFGPVATLIPFSSKEEVIEAANSTDYGLAASVWTENLSLAHEVAARLESGMVWINSWMERDLRTPFGGVKSSGVGREGGWEAMRFFTEPKNISVSVHHGE